MTVDIHLQYRGIYFLIPDKAESFMYLIVIAWIYVVLMMSVAEATNSNGTVLGALVTFVLYGAGPVALVVYLMRAPARSKAIKKREAAEVAKRAANEGSIEAAQASGAIEPAGEAPSGQPDAGSQSPRGPKAVAADAGVAPVGKKL